MQKPIKVTMTFKSPLLVRAIHDILGSNPSFRLSESSLSEISCKDAEEIDVILCETELLTNLEKEHICLAPKTLGISVWNNMISVSKGDLQSYEELDEIIAYIEKIASQDKLHKKCDQCLTLNNNK